MRHRTDFRQVSRTIPSSEEPQIHPSVPGPRPTADSAPTPKTARTTPSGPRPGPRPAPPRADGSRPKSGRPSGGRAAPGPTGNAPAAEIRLVDATDATALDVADSTVDALLDEGRAPGEVLVLTTGGPHPWTQHELSFGEEAYWRQQGEAQDVFFAEVGVARRATPRPVVVLAVNGGADSEVAEALPVALGRARVRLVVCGDPQRLRRLL